MPKHAENPFKVNLWKGRRICQSEGCERGYLILVRVGMGPGPWGRVGGGGGVGGGVGGHG